MPEISDPMHSAIFMVEVIWYHNFTWSGPNLQETQIFVMIIGPQEPKLNYNKFQNFLWVCSTSAKIMISYVFYHENKGIYGSWAKTGYQKYGVWVSVNPFHAYEN